jgi:hypothetical protein
MSSANLCAALLVSLLLTACAAQVPYRSAGFTAAPECRPLYEQSRGGKPIGSPESACWKRSEEERKDYDLLFIEFDDQGWTQGTSAERKQGPDHMDRLLDKLAQLIADNRSTGISLVVFVHGWHHSAEANDDNVREFRSLLRDVSVIEGDAGRRRVVGLYVGWRGDSLTTPGLNMLTFWDRKATAEKVAQGSVRELFSRLDTLRDRAAKEAPTDPKPVRMLAIGHSFGGLITFESLSGDFINGAVQHRDGRPVPDAAGKCGNAAGYFLRVGDLVVVANPAFEGARYEALRAAAQRVRCIPDDQWPVLITATSDADRATGVAFPIARWFNTLFETDPAQQREANVQTVGHNDRYTTHKLSVCDPSDVACRQACANPGLLKADVKGTERDERLRAELGSAGALRHAFFGKQEYLCDSLKLASTEQWQPVGNPYWVVETTGDIMNGHNDIFNPAFVAFVRQMYIGVRSATHGR